MNRWRSIVSGHVRDRQVQAAVIRSAIAAAVPDEPRCRKGFAFRYIGAGEYAWIELSSKRRNTWCDEIAKRKRIAKRRAKKGYK